MNLSELFEYKLFKNDAGFKIYMNPSAGDIRAILRSSYILTKVPDIDLDTPIDKLDDFDDEYIHHGGAIHGLDYPLRGVVIDSTVYIVDSYDADHEDLYKTLNDQGVDTDTARVQVIPIVIEKQSTAPRGDLEDYMIGAAGTQLNTLKKIPTVTRMKMPIGVWN